MAGASSPSAASKGAVWELRDVEDALSLVEGWTNSGTCVVRVQPDGTDQFAGRLSGDVFLATNYDAGVVVAWRVPFMAGGAVKVAQADVMASALQVSPQAHGYVLATTLGQPEAFYVRVELPTKKPALVFQPSAPKDAFFGLVHMSRGPRLAFFDGDRFVVEQQEQALLATLPGKGPAEAVVARWSQQSGQTSLRLERVAYHQGTFSCLQVLGVSTDFGKTEQLSALLLRMLPMEGSSTLFYVVGAELDKPRLHTAVLDTKTPMEPMFHHIQDYACSCVTAQRQSCIMQHLASGVDQSGDWRVFAAGGFCLLSFNFHLAEFPRTPTEHVWSSRDLGQRVASARFSSLAIGSRHALVPLESGKVVAVPIRSDE